jgi:hypothetical protein
MIGCFKFKGARLTIDFRTHSNNLTMLIDDSSNTAVKQILNELDENEIYYAEISKPKRKRTLDQNAYLWALCQRIAEKIGATKEEVYRGFIKSKGQFDILCIQDKAIERFISNWSAKGIGWFCETDTSKIVGCTNVITYYGTSVYTSAEMAQVLSEALEECKNLNISTIVDGYREENND